MSMIKNTCTMLFNTKKFTISSAAALILLVSLPWAVTACNDRKLGTSEAKSINFRFEDYEKAEDVQKKLLELYPVGSDYKVVSDNLKSINRMFCLRAEQASSLNCEYLIPTSKFSSIAWTVNISEKAGKVTKIKAYKTFSSI